jgi:2-C-methyl-D-erythritol 4-phosphate cytidylyltransferase
MNVKATLTQKRVAGLIPAAGSGVRMGGDIAKPFLQLGGREILAHTLDVFERSAVIDELWVVVAAKNVSACQQGIIKRYGFRKVRDVVAGGASRQESVWRGLQRIDAAVDLVVVHDGVRPFVTEAVLQETLGCAAQHGAAVAAVPLRDTLKRISEGGVVEATVPRENLWRTQTPQAFQRHLLMSAYRQAWERGVCATDDAGLLESIGHPVKVVSGLESNIKITTPEDLIFSEGLLRTPRQ